jgi:uracil-DNA glycosylase
MNCVLTVRQGEANSHAKKGWEEFTDEVIRVLNEEKDGLVFLLWGSAAQKKASVVDENRHTLIQTSHPSPLGATKTKSPFLGSRCFSRANEALKSYDKEPVDWDIL